MEKLAAYEVHKNELQQKTKFPILTRLLLKHMKNIYILFLKQYKELREGGKGTVVQSEKLLLGQLFVSVGPKIKLCLFFFSEKIIISTLPLD